jgi:glycosyltransferase involved in cell wall biosynthesis
MAMTATEVRREPDVSLVMPCYNEEKIVAYSIRRLVQAFAREGYRLELVAVDNGSSDRTGAIIADIARREPSVVPCRVEQNRGYGYGVLEGMKCCTAPWVGHIPADSQVDAEDVVRLFETALIGGERVVAKVRRRFRMDGMNRRVVTFAYNTLIRLLWPGLGSFDVNAVPKLLPRDLLAQLRLESWGWALDPEMMVKAHYLGIPILEYNIMARQRAGGHSHVRMGTAWELFASLLQLRFSGQLREWRRTMRASRARTVTVSGATGP